MFSGPRAFRLWPFVGASCCHRPDTSCISRGLFEGYACRQKTPKSTCLMASVSPLSDVDCVLQAPIFWTSKGFRTMALAWGKLLPQSRHKLHELSLADLRQNMCQTKLLGFSVVTNSLCSDTKAAITELQDRLPLCLCCV